MLAVVCEALPIVTSWRALTLRFDPANCPAVVMPASSIFGPSLWVGVVLGAFAAWALATAFAWLTRPRVKHYGFVTRTPEYEGGYLHKIWFELFGAAPGICSIEFTFKDQSRFAKWDEAGLPETWSGAFSSAAVPGTSTQVVHVGRIYTVPIVHQRDGEYRLFSGWWYGRKLHPDGTATLKPQDKIRIALSGQGLQWVRTLTVGEICDGPQVWHAESDAYQGLIRSHVTACVAKSSRIWPRELPSYSCGGVLAWIRLGLWRRPAAANPAGQSV